MPGPDTDARKNRDDELKPGSPPRHASHSQSSKESARTTKTLTDPATGEPRNEPPKPSRAAR